MSVKIESYCGILCTACEYRDSCNCGTCVATKGKPFHQKEDETCPVAACAIGRNLRFCGECWEFPCELLKQFSFDKEQGDDGKRIEQCKKWKTELVAEARTGLDPISVCGHHCDYCFMGQWCGGCRSDYNCCSFATISEGGICPNVKCATKRGLDACYDCPDLRDCQKGYYGKEYNDEHEYTAKATAMFIHKYGKEEYTRTLQTAIAAGAAYAKDFDETGSVEAALKKLESFL